MDPLSVTASVIAVLQLTHSVIGYLNDVKNAPEEWQDCTIEASNLHSLLTSLRFRLEKAQTQPQDPWYTTARALNVENGPLDQYKRALEQLATTVDGSDGTKKLRTRLVWKFKKTEVAGLLRRIERLKSFVSLALGEDHL